MNLNNSNRYQSELLLLSKCNIIPPFVGIKCFNYK
jgi:hypothetical protein